jgi:hypothetical protein
LIGAIVDQSTNDGQASLSVSDSRADILALYGGLVNQEDRLPLKQSIVLPVAFVPRTVEAKPVPPARIDPTACAPLIPAKAASGADVYQSPDPTSAVLTTFKAATPVCTSATEIGYGFRRVKSVDGADGFVKDVDVSR